MTFARKMPEFYIIIARKIFFPNFRGHVPTLRPPSPTLLQQLLRPSVPVCVCDLEWRSVTVAVVVVWLSGRPMNSENLVISRPSLDCPVPSVCQQLSSIRRFNIYLTFASLIFSLPVKLLRQLLGPFRDIFILTLPVAYLEIWRGYISAVHFCRVFTYLYGCSWVLLFI